MEITEVIRGAEWLPSLPLHYLLYKAFGWEDTMPRFAHLSLLLKPDGKGKLSKRDGDRLGFPVFPLKWVNPETQEVSRGYREDGYYPEAFVNLLALLGWNPGTEQEIFTLEELIPIFSLDRVIKSGAKFNVEKAKWFNEQFLRRRTAAQLAQEFAPAVMEKTGREYSQLFLEEVCTLIKERAHFSTEFWDISKALFLCPAGSAQVTAAAQPETPVAVYNLDDVKKFCTEENKAHVAELLNLIKESTFPTFTDNQEERTALLSTAADNATTPVSTDANQPSASPQPATYKELCCCKIEELLTGYIKAKEWKMGQVMNTLRLFFTGNTRGLGISDIIYFIGKECTIKRIEAGLKAC